MCFDVGLLLTVVPLNKTFEIILKKAYDNAVNKKIRKRMHKSYERLLTENWISFNYILHEQYNNVFAKTQEDRLFHYAFTTNPCLLCGWHTKVCTPNIGETICFHKNIWFFTTVVEFTFLTWLPTKQRMMYTGKILTRSINVI